MSLGTKEHYEDLHKMARRLRKAKAKVRRLTKEIGELATQVDGPSRAHCS